MWSQSRKEMLVEIEGKKLERAQVISELTDRIVELGGAKEELNKRKQIKGWDIIPSKILNWAASSTRVEAWVNAMDKNFNGVFRRYIWAPVNDAITTYRIAKQETFTKLEKEILSKYENLFNDKNEIQAPEINYTFNSDSELLMAILHSGNASNMDKLVRGSGWGVIDPVSGEADLSRWTSFLNKAMKDGRITKAHLDLAQEIWDLMNSFLPGTQKAHKELYGHYFDEITANEIVTPWGAYRGGYIPAVVDPNLDTTAKIRAARKELEDTSYANAFPSTGKGATMKRVQAYAAPLSLEFNLITSHIDWALRFTHIQPAIKSVQKIIMHKTFKDSLETLNSNIIPDVLLPWLQRSAVQKVMTPGGVPWIDNAARFMRTSASLQIMFGNFSNGLQQLTGVIIGMAKIPPKYVVGGIIKQFTSPFETNKIINEMSPWMRGTVNSNVYETQTAIKELLVDKDLFTNIKRSKEAITKHGYIFAKMFQGITSNAVWMGAFNEYTEKGYSKEEAIKYADSTVRLTQGAATAENVSAFEVGTPVGLLFKQFISYFNMLANLQVSEATRIMRDAHTPKKAPQLAYLYMMAHALPAIAAKAIFIAVGKGFQSDDDEELEAQMVDVFAWSQLQTLTAMLPFGQAFNALTNRFNENKYDDRLNMSPAIQMSETTLNIAGMIYEKTSEDKEFSEKDMNDIATALGFISGSPVLPLWKRGRYVYRSMEGEIESSDPVDFTRGVLVGKASKPE